MVKSVKELCYEHQYETSRTNKLVDCCQKYYIYYHRKEFIMHNVSFELTKSFPLWLSSARLSI